MDYLPPLSNILLAPLRYFTDPGSRAFGLYLGTSVLIALISLYVPKQKEAIEFGIGNGEEQLYSSPLKLYLLPFKRALRLLRKRDS
jgi:hypothetical protein